MQALHFARLFVSLHFKCEKYSKASHGKVKKMIRLFLISLLIIAVCMALMSVTILIKKGGRFPNTHVCGNKHLRKKGITSAQTQDKQAQRENRMAVKEKRYRTDNE